MTKTQARKRCENLMLEIGILERAGKYGTPDWHKFQKSLHSALKAYREHGATLADMFGLIR